MANADIQLDQQGSVCMFTPLTQAAREWVDEHLNLEGWQWLGNSFAVEPRFVAALVAGMKNDGLKVA